VVVPGLMLGVLLVVLVPLLVEEGVTPSLVHSDPWRPSFFDSRHRAQRSRST
jgi:hypothetical protein